MRYIKIILFILIVTSKAYSQQKEKVRWITFEQLDDSLSIKPKKVLISFYADWCAYCKKMDRAVFTKPNIAKKINEDYYAVKMNAESTDTIHFDGTVFTNRNYLENRNAIHEIPILLASREKQPFSLPATIFLDEQFHIRKRYFEYMSPKRLLSVLEQLD
ncbi:thioredoxin family protein [Aquimarina sp. D1M17]|uniref:thioredoxin family protein n=1 Tax=Aquimarina acroporae TaxID=2937283 RepID=UPI0020BFC5D8|nr:thioredoxin fold domain-containing protein [Aquimarina acroporae]MCK8522039.1 thioredoxin family protein [Aquimarina acroporae]